MTHSHIHEEAVELLLASISKERGSGFKHSFEFGPPGALPWQMGLVTDIYYRPNKLIRAVLHVRQSGPAYLRLISIEEVQRMLQAFVAQNFGYLMDDVFLIKFTGSFADQVSQAAKSKFADALATSPIFQPRSELTLFPLATVQVQTDFDSQPFFLAAPGSLNAARLPGINFQYIAPEMFPPLSKWEGRHKRPAAWLGLWSPAYRASNKMKAAILGSLALTPLPHYRHMFSGRAVFGGHCTFNDGSTTTSFGEAHTPALAQDIIISGRDHAWLEILALKLIDSRLTARREMKALEYFYRAWGLGPSERFPVLCMAIDAIFGEANNSSQAIINGVRAVVGPNVNDTRLRTLLVGLRNSIIHGGAPDVYDSRKYGRYFDTYEADPIRDLELVVAACLRQRIFQGALAEHPDPNAARIAEAQAKGHLPQDLSSRTILDGIPP